VGKVVQIGVATLDPYHDDGGYRLVRVDGVTNLDGQVHFQITNLRETNLRLRTWIDGIYIDHDCAPNLCFEGPTELRRLSAIADFKPVGPRSLITQDAAWKLRREISAYYKAKSEYERNLDLQREALEKAKLTRTVAWCAGLSVVTVGTFVGAMVYRSNTKKERLLDTSKTAVTAPVVPGDPSGALPEAEPAEKRIEREAVTREHNRMLELAQRIFDSFTYNANFSYGRAGKELAVTIPAGVSDAAALNALNVYFKNGYYSKGRDYINSAYLQEFAKLASERTNDIQKPRTYKVWKLEGGNLSYEAKCAGYTVVEGKGYAVQEGSEEDQETLLKMLNLQLADPLEAMLVLAAHAAGRPISRAFGLENDPMNRAVRVDRALFTEDPEGVKIILNPGFDKNKPPTDVLVRCPERLYRRP
jgi:hypothetical protein